MNIFNTNNSKRLLESIVSRATLVFVLAFASLASGHPSLFFAGSDIPSLRSQAQGTHQSIFQPLRQGAETFVGSNVDRTGLVRWSNRSVSLGDRRHIGNALVTFAFVSQLTGDARHLTLARDWLLRVASFGSFDLDGTHDLVQAHLLGGAAIAYDLLAGNLSTSEANMVVAALSRNATELRSAGLAGQWWETQFLQNHNWINHAAVGLAALATQEDLPAGLTAPWLSYAVDNARSVQMTLDTVVDGTFHEGFGLEPFQPKPAHPGSEHSSDGGLFDGAGNPEQCGFGSGAGRRRRGVAVVEEKQEAEAAMTPTQILTAARDLLIRNGWHQHPNSTEFCALLAICDAATPRTPMVNNAIGWFVKVINTPQIADWNDAPGRTMWGVLAAFNDAIRLAEAGRG